MSTQATIKNNANGMIGSGSDLMRRAMHQRRIKSAVPHIFPILDSLPASSVVLEVGCGAGGITLDIAQRYPHLEVLGMDIDEKSIELANETAKTAGTSNIRYATGNAVELVASLASVSGFEAIDGGCSLVYSHAAVMHTPDQLEVIKQMRKAAKPGGTISLKEGDAGLFLAYPEIPGMARLLEVFPLLGASKGADMFLGRKLLSHALSAGFRMESIEVSISGQIQYKPQEKQGMAMGMTSIFEDVLRNPGQLHAVSFSQEDVDLIRQGLEEWAQCEDGIIAFPSIVVDCKKE